MINREHPSDLNGMRHTDFGYFAGGIADGRTAASQHVSSVSETCTALTISGAPGQSPGSRYQARPASIQSPRSAVIESRDGQLPIEQHNNVAALRWGSGRGGARW